jgi:serine protease inhibitor
MIVLMISTGSVQVDMMRQTGMFRLAQMNDADAVALDLPYKGQKLSLTIILPKQEDGLKHLEKRFFLFYIKLELGYTNKACKSNFLQSCC